MRIDGRFLQLSFGPVDVECDSTSVVLDNEDADADLVTFGDVLAGNNRRWFFTVTAFPGAAVGLPGYGIGTFWELLWSTPAYTAIPYVLNPHGVSTPTTQKPWFVGDVVVDQKPPVGGDAFTAWTFTTRLTCTANPTRRTAIVTP